jgi:hypothetical protein
LNTSWLIVGILSKEKKGRLYMASSIAEMIKKAKEEVGSSDSKHITESADEGIKIERQNVDHVRGQAKSGE